MRAQRKRNLLLILGLGCLAIINILARQYIVLNSYDVSFMNETFKTLKRLDDPTERRVASVRPFLVKQKDEVRLIQAVPKNISSAISSKVEAYSENTNPVEDVELGQLQALRLTSIFDIKTYGKILDNRDATLPENRFSGEVVLSDGKIQSLTFELPGREGGGFTGTVQKIVIENITELDDGMTFRYSFDGEDAQTGVITKSADEISVSFSQSGHFAGLKLMFASEAKLEREEAYEMNAKFGAQILDEQNDEVIQEIEDEQTMALEERIQELPAQEKLEIEDLPSVLPASYNFGKNGPEQAGHEDVQAEDQT